METKNEDFLKLDKQKRLEFLLKKIYLQHRRPDLDLSGVFTIFYLIGFVLLFATNLYFISFSAFVSMFELLPLLIYFAFLVFIISFVMYLIRSLNYKKFEAEILDGFFELKPTEKDGS